MSERINLLIVDDDLGDRTQLRRLLSKSGLACEFVEVTNMDDALQVCGERSFHAAVVDYLMPGLDGLGGIEKLHQRCPHLPIIMSTGQGCEQVAAEAIKLGAADYIPKSQIDAPSIRRAIESSVERARLSRKLAEQQEALTSFARVLAHDLKSPIATILGFTALLEIELADSGCDHEKAIQRCQRVSRAARGMLGIIETLHQYTQLEAEVAFGPVSMQQVMDDLMMALESRLAESGAIVGYHDLPMVHGNAPQLMQLMQNLVANGIKFCDAPNPVIRITAAPGQDGRSWGFEVRDYGIGIPEADCPHVFEPFKRLETANRYEGTGLGLAICKKIIERHGGRIWCKPGDGGGTRFFFTLPAVETPSA